MLKIGCANINAIIKLLNGNEIEGIRFKLLKSEGISATFSHENATAYQAKDIIKPILKKDVNTRNYFISVEAIEE